MCEGTTGVILEGFFHFFSWRSLSILFQPQWILQELWPISQFIRTEYSH